MEQRTASRIAFVAAAATAALAATLMSGNARAEGPCEDIRPITGTLSRKAVMEETMAQRAQLTSYGAEWMQQQTMGPQARSIVSREELRAAYIAARDQVRAMNAEDSGSGALAHGNARTPQRMLAEAPAR